MAGMLFWTGVFIASLAVLVKAADMFTDAAERIGLRFGIPPFIIGITIVAMGTSLPELVSSVLSVLNGAQGIVSGNVVGANIANICFILGIAALAAREITIDRDLVRVDLPILILSAFFLALVTFDGVVLWLEGVIGLLLFGAYIHFTISEKDIEDRDELLDQDIVEAVEEERSIVPYLMLVVAGAFIYVGANYTIMSITELSALIGVSQDIIALTAMSLGTTLPELVVSVRSAQNGKAEIAVGNILGSNIFNTYVVLGAGSLTAGALTVPADIVSFAVPALLAASLLYFFMTQNREITMWEGGSLLLFYAVFLVNIIL